MRRRPEVQAYLVRSIPALAAIPLGFAAFFGPTIIGRLASGQPVSIESLGSAQENCHVTQLLFLGLVGCGIALFTRAPALMIGVFTIASLPIWSLADASDAYRHGVERHNLLGIEWGFYAVYGAFPAAGALLVRRVSRRGQRSSSGGAG